MREEILSLWDVIARTARRILNVALVLCAISAVVIGYLVVFGAPTAKEVGNGLFLLIGLPASWMLVWFPFSELAELVRERHADREKFEGAIWRLSEEVRQLREYIAVKTDVTPDKVRLD